METIQKRHNRYGLVAECSLSAFGNVSTCQNHDSDNNGLWTSLVVAAELIRGNTSEIETYLSGMQLLHDITGVPGLIARSALPPGTPWPSYGTWANSTVPKYKGWIWKADASSDEVDGHVFALSTAASLLPPSSPLRDTAIDLLTKMAMYIVTNDFYLIDFTGKPTTWGVWNPQQINGERSWSDGRGLNSLEILALIASAIGVETNQTAVSILQNAWDYLVDDKNQYLQNTLNLKIESPIDDNYSDDELTFLPYWSLLVAANNSAVLQRALPSLCASIARTFDIVKPLRSDFWAAVYLHASRRHPTLLPPLPVSLDALWNLQTWPLELIEWPVMNSHRLDITIDPAMDRGGHQGTDSYRRILPANERPQGRWNSNPHDLDGGSGMDEMDAGVFLAPYWLGVAVDLGN